MKENLGSRASSKIAFLSRFLAAKSNHPKLHVLRQTASRVYLYIYIYIMGTVYTYIYIYISDIYLYISICIDARDIIIYIYISMIFNDNGRG